MEGRPRAQIQPDFLGTSEDIGISKIPHDDVASDVFAFERNPSKLRPDFVLPLSLSLCLSIHLLNSRQWLAIFLSLYYLVLRSNMRSLSSRKKYWDFYFFFFIVSFRAEHFTFSSVYFDYINYWNEMKLFEIQWKMKKF